METQNIHNRRSLELSEIHLDALREICNIGMGHAATAFNQMIGKTILFSIPEISNVPPEEVPDLLGGSEKMVAGIYFNIWGDVQGNILMVFPKQSAYDLCSLLTGGAPEDELVLSEIHASALQEIGNILVSSYLSALESLLGKTLIPSIPSVSFEVAGKLAHKILDRLGEGVERTLVIKTVFYDDEDGINGHFFLLPDPPSLRIILEAARVLAVEEAEE